MVDRRFGVLLGWGRRGLKYFRCRRYGELLDLFALGVGRKRRKRVGDIGKQGRAGALGREGLFGP